MNFAQDDFQTINKEFRFFYWGGNDGHMLGESYYSIAVTAGNISAATSFEYWKKRKPFILDNVENTSWDVYLRGSFSSKKGRVAIGLEFPWKGEQARVTSFSEGGSYIIACSYKKKSPDEPCRGNEILHRHKITIKDIRENRKFQKKKLA